MNKPTKKVNPYSKQFDGWCNCGNFPFEMCEKCDEYFLEKGYITPNHKKMKNAGLAE